jgi:uncharacterized protein
MKKIKKLNSIFSKMGPRIVAASGGLDSLLLATLSHRADPDRTLVAHGSSPAVPKEAQERLKKFAKEHGWNLVCVKTDEFDDEAYLGNPYDRCYFCKTHLYGLLKQLQYDATKKNFSRLRHRTGQACVILSGANIDDLGEHRPGLRAAAEAGVRHPFIEAGIGKADIRGIARDLGLPFWDLAASPCLASRIYTGTRITPERLALVDAAEIRLRKLTGAKVVRCRLKERRMLVEVPADDRKKFKPAVLDVLRKELLNNGSNLNELILDEKPYRPGRAFVES